MPKREVQDFISHWSAATASERANSQPFPLDLCDLLDVPRPDPQPADGYFFEFPVVEHNPDGSTSQGRIDLYKRATFVLESKQFQEARAAASHLELAAQEAGVIARKKSSQPARGTGAWDDAKEKLIHDQGLVSVLKQLHDDLDAAVFTAYGWPATLADAEILERLVALNAERAAEEKRGIIHWLRPDYQARSQEELVLPQTEGKPAKPAKAKTAKPARATKTPWPSKMAERVQAVEAALHRRGTATPDQLAGQFKRAQPADVAEILETLVTMGRARRHGEQFTT